MTKKFPMSEFRSPYIPDQDRQELPNSVVLDFKDGSTLQCACEHPQGQAGVLQSMWCLHQSECTSTNRNLVPALREAHSLHQS